MNKAELIEVVASRIDASKKDAAEAVQAVVDAIQEAVAKGQKVSISGFGVFETAARPARTYRKPSTGEAIEKLATAVPKFRPGGDFKALVSGEKSIGAQAVKIARDAGEDLRDVAEGAVRLVTGQRSAKSAPAPVETPVEPAAKKAPVKRAPVKRAPAAAKKAPVKRAPAKRAAPAAKPEAAAASSPAASE
jgi:DNA-binding protein HU-beta